MMVAIFKTQCCEELYVMGNYSGEREEKMALLANYPHVYCHTHARYAPLIFATYYDNDRLRLRDVRQQKLSSAHAAEVRAFINRLTDTTWECVYANYQNAPGPLVKCWGCGAELRPDQTDTHRCGGQVPARPVKPALIGGAA